MAPSVPSSAGVRMTGNGKSDACIPGGGFDDGMSLTESAFAFCRFNHAECNAVLDASGRVETLQFGEDVHLRVGT